jgi:ribosome-associated protein
MTGFGQLRAVPVREAGHGESRENTPTLSASPPQRRADSAQEHPLSAAVLQAVRTPLLPALDRAVLAAQAASENKGRDILVLDMREITPLYDYFVIATGQSRRQIHAVAEETDAKLRDAGDRRQGIEGYEASKWIVQDYGDVVVHTFDPETREYYKLEDLWADAPRVEWERM